MRNSDDRRSKETCSVKDNSGEAGFKAFVIASFVSLTLLTLYVAVVAR